jgi:hypothetical protein
MPTVQKMITFCSQSELALGASLDHVEAALIEALALRLLRSFIW